uniref:Uncharacterized protein n=1 Tax=Triticum urartu TaxID=4572 RepID=A0A8R7Q0T6_TRIUA
KRKKTYVHALCLHLQVHVDLEHGVVGGGVVGIRPKQAVSSSPAEGAGAADDRQLPDGVEDGVPGEHGDGAAVVLPRREQQVGAEQQRGVRLRREEVEPLRPPDDRRRRTGPLGESIVDGVHVAEAVAGVVRQRRQAPDDAHRRGRSRRLRRHDVVHVEAEVRRGWSHRGDERQRGQCHQLHAVVDGHGAQV